MNNTTILLTRTILSAVSQLPDINTDSNFSTLLPFLIILIGIGGIGLLIHAKPEYLQEFLNNPPRNPNPSPVVFDHDNLEARRGVDIPLQQIVRHSTNIDSDESFGNRGNLPNNIQNDSISFHTSDSDHFTNVDLNSRSSDHSSNSHYQELRSQIDFNSNSNPFTGDNDSVRPDSTLPNLSQLNNTVQNMDLGDPTNIYDSFGF